MKTDLHLANYIREIGQLEPFVKAIGRKLRFSSELTLQLHLVLEEAVSNIIFYAYPGQEGQRIDIQAEYDTDRLTFTISDTGVAFDPTQVPEADITLSAEERPIGGLGIFLMRKLMDSVEYRRSEGRNTLVLRKKLNDKKYRNNQ